MPADAKAALRTAMRARRRALAMSLPQAGEQAAGLLPLHALPAYACIGAYMPLGSEIDCWPLVERLAASGAIIGLPRAEAADAPMAFREYDPADQMTPDASGILSPPASAREVHPDIVIAPLVAFARDGARLGQGGGHYDRTLAELRARKPVFVLGLAFSGQEVDAIPVGEHDQALDAILTETGYIAVRQGE